VLGVTGGVATGKSAFTKSLLHWLPASQFNADACAHRLLKADETVREELRCRFGTGIFTADGLVDRQKLRSLVFNNDEKRRELEALLHPRIRGEWTKSAAKAREAGQWLVVDIPLLYETHAERHFDAVVVIAAARSTQLERMSRHRGLNETEALRIIESQMDLGSKMAMATHVVWNNSSEEHLDQQSRILAEILIKRHG
jgi:dephospho-CoA kinase